ncbi:uncharacterized protein JCM15063_006229 [Sporobolomyces koalae]|uniref:uncharacterized protein n=1 Tax=Sporobolomyces koalae TaxID=500713 RepID=UPI0031767F97
MSFTPALATTTWVRLERSSSSPSTLYFTFRPNHEESIGFAPQVWTNLPVLATSGREPGGETWHSIPFHPSTDPNHQGLWIAKYLVAQDQFEGQYEFTYRIRHEHDRIEWVGSQGGNGRVAIAHQSTATPPRNNSIELQGWDLTDRGVSVRQFHVPDGLDEIEHDLSTVVQSLLTGAGTVRGLTLEQSSRTWFTPRPFEANPDSLFAPLSTDYVSQLVLFESTDQDRIARLVVCPFSSTATNASLIARDDGQGHKRLFVRCQKDATDNSEQGGIVLVSSELSSFSYMIEQAVRAARIALKQNLDEGKDQAEAQPLKDLSLCTWNALGPDYTVTSLLSWIDRVLDPAYSTPELIESLKRGGIMLDDGWQDTAHFQGHQGEDLRGLRGYGTRQGWYDGEPCERGDELRIAVEHIKQRGIERIGVWITITGYWNCLHPEFDDSSISTTLATFFSPHHDNFLFKAHVPTLGSLRPFFSTYFAKIKQAGVSFIKIDNQALVDSVWHLADGTVAGVYRAELLRVIQEESARVFEGEENVVHCMAHCTRIWSGPLALAPRSLRPLPTLRNSDDFFPNEPDSHRWHVYINSINLSLTRHLAFEPDLDMAQEGHEYGAFHIALRAFSTAGIWSTDTADTGRLGETSTGWRGLLARTKRTGCRVVQARAQAGSILSNQLLSTNITRSPHESGRGEALKVGLESTRAKGATIGMWNCQQDGTVEATLTTRDVWDVVTSWEPTRDLFVLIDESFGPAPSAASVPSTQQKALVSIVTLDSLRSSTRAATESLSLPIVSLGLPSKTVQIVTLAELDEIRNHEGKTVRVACLGLRDKFVGIEAVHSIRVVETDHESAEPTRVSVSIPKPLDTAPSATRTNFPLLPPNTHVPFLLSYFSNALFPSMRQSASPSASSKASPTRTPSNEFSALFRSFLTRPISTLISEVRGIFTFGLAVAVWAFRSRRATAPNPNGRAIEEGTRAHEDKEEVATFDATVKLEKRSVRATKMQVELEFVSAQLAFGFSPALKSTSEIEITLDGKLVEDKYVTLVGELGLVQVDIEGFWEDNGRRMQLGGNNFWLVELESK